MRQTRLMAGASVRAIAGGLGIYVLAALAIALAFLFVPGFATADNLANVLTQSAALGLVAIGQTFVIIAGLIDLSVGQLLGLVVVLTCALTDGRPELLAPVRARAGGDGRRGRRLAWLAGQSPAHRTADPHLRHASVLQG